MHHLGVPYESVLDEHNWVTKVPPSLGRVSPKPSSFHLTLCKDRWCTAKHTLVSFDLWIWWKSVSYSHVIHPTWCAGGCYFTLAEISHGSSLLRGHLHTENINLWCILDPRSLLVQVLNEMLTLVILNGSQKCGNRHPEGLNIYMGMGMFLCIIEESSSYSLWNQKKNWSLPNKGKIWVKICLLIFWMLIVSMPLFQTWESLERTSKRLI